MPRKPRMYLPGVPCHVVQRGNDRQACFFEPGDYRCYLDYLAAAAHRYEVAVHAYVLMTNHVHLLMTPATADGISRLMQLLGNRYVQCVNKKYRRSGTLWEGRHRASLVDAEDYLLACYRYIELNPVRAGMVSHPGAYRWSSYRHHAWGTPDPLVKDHELFHQLARDPGERRRCYRALFETGRGPSEDDAIRRAGRLSVPLGNEGFYARVAAALQRPVRSRRGRPPATK